MQEALETQITVLWTRGGGRREGTDGESGMRSSTAMHETAGQWSLLCDSELTPAQ